MNYLSMCDQLVVISQQACAAIHQTVRDGLQTRTKADRSTVTNADLASEAVIVSALRSLYPTIPVVSEEEHSSGMRVHWDQTVWFVDPLDSTSGFARGSADYAVCIGLVHQGTPILGAVAVPHTGEVFVGSVPDQLAYRVDANNQKQTISASLHGQTDHIVVHSSSESMSVHKLIAPHSKFVARGSAIKFALVAEGRAAVYPRWSQLCNWDIAAGEAVVRAAGGSVTDMRGQPLKYVPGKIWQPTFVAWSEI
jgi:3'(2'), 5'-bisphosphate nucleotidase